MVSLADAARKALQVGRKRKAKDASDAGCASALAAFPARLSPPRSLESTSLNPAPLPPRPLATSIHQGRNFR